MSLSFLSKKSWHVANVSNVEKVWLAEQKLEQEKKKLEEYTHTLKEERQKEELLRLQQEQGLVAPRKERVDFLYEQQETAASAYLLGKPVELKPEDHDIKKAPAHLPGSNFLNGQNNLSSSHNEEFNKMNNDPLVMMRAKEQEAPAGEGPDRERARNHPGDQPPP
ncbi:hypothetical protein EMIHUDRAFT_240288 [Emiliania huxleyi CCMP1516]|uniref:CBF1-interacting co-repressor CIR N-terminal domain-containing protein n=2 Tax=Emiliania huxleyi TaxID=2903 RepID=A0A0D3JG73_EMIH1|nr:hypothetical protein EMIHUDRAFT_240288 [Emiliania huxleyi CCMP1516]EOD22508.1 hypothetical protein EMIHUDRAFT_240288 [Emiliania huxleyi CCMP1516]|eukprot:XP_005774937.1 hypothetical protein EMIHUDRAFT_240288 [Emiliania huxleyi CCMP1516]